MILPTSRLPSPRARVAVRGSRAAPSADELRARGVWPFPARGGPMPLTQAEQTRRACAAVGEATW